MKDFLITVGAILITGIVVLLCLLSCYLAGRADEFWENKKRQMENEDERR